MVEELYKDICAGRAVRENLIALRARLADPETKRRFAYLLGGEFRVLTRLLKAEDPKIRKNAARILGEMETEDVLPFLFGAWEKEDTLYVRSEYLKAMRGLDCRRYSRELRERRDKLLGTQAKEEERKHVREELLALDAILGTMERKERHVFAGCPAGEAQVILITGEMQRETTAALIHTGTVKLQKSGLHVYGGDLEEILRIRTWARLLFPLPGNALLKGDAPQIGRQLAARNIPGWLDEMHQGTGTWRYRLDIRSGAEAKEKGKLIRGISEALDRLGGGKLMNSVSDYEVELRLVQRKDGAYLPMVQLFTLRDRRFAYRREVISDSVSPVQAALAMELARPWLKEKAQVLDPFCGTGTMLIERGYAVQAGAMYGLDIFGEAIEKARANTKITGMQIHYINRDFFDFRHEYRFDEIVTDLPRRSAQPDMTVRQLYRAFLDRVKELLADGAVLVLYTMEPALLHGCLGEPEAECYQIKGSFPMLPDNRAEVIIVTYEAAME